VQLLVDGSHGVPVGGIAVAAPRQHEQEVAAGTVSVRIATAAPAVRTHELIGRLTVVEVVAFGQVTRKDDLERHENALENLANDEEERRSPKESSRPTVSEGWRGRRDSNPRPPA
jgi:hypothetical protein